VRPRSSGKPILCSGPEDSSNSAFRPHYGTTPITLKGSKQAGVTGFKGGIVRKVAVDKTRSSLERMLVSVKQKLEAPATQL
jgi:hypothetical protein